MNDGKGPKHLYTIRYTIKPKVSEAMEEMEVLQDLAQELLNVQMEIDGFPDAKDVIARIKAKL